MTYQILNVIKKKKEAYKKYANDQDIEKINFLTLLNCSKIRL